MEIVGSKNKIDSYQKVYLLFSINLWKAIDIYDLLNELKWTKWTNELKTNWIEVLPNVMATQWKCCKLL